VNTNSVLLIIMANQTTYIAGFERPLLLKNIESKDRPCTFLPLSCLTNPPLFSCCSEHSLTDSFFYNKVISAITPGRATFTIFAYAGSLAGTLSVLTVSNSLLAILAGLLADLTARYVSTLYEVSDFRFW
jgi:hypothetical protein